MRLTNAFFTSSFLDPSIRSNAPCSSQAIVQPLAGPVTVGDNSDSQTAEVPQDNSDAGRGQAEVVGQEPTLTEMKVSAPSNSLTPQGQGHTRGRRSPGQ